MLTRRDLIGPEWLVVATLPGGDRFVIEEHHDRCVAEVRAAMFRKYLESCERVEVERAGVEA